KSGVLYRGERLEPDEHALDPQLDAIIAQRRYLVIASVILGVLFTMIDAGCLWREYGFLSTIAECRERDFDFTTAFRLQAEFAAVNKTTNGLFVAVAYVLQGALIAYGWM